MNPITELYQLLFGKDHLKDGDVIEMAEHGRVGGLSTGEGYKKTGLWEMPPTDPSKTNESLVLGYTGSNLTTITKTINGTDYQKTLTYDGSNNLTDISAWVEL